MATKTTSLARESQDRYLTYALSVISERALPDVRDGLKPVQRRILFAMLQNLKLKPSGSHRKSAAVVGEVLGKYHPHGDVPCYEAMVRLAQDFSLRYPLVDGQGNFGSLDGDSPAAYRYTEAKLKEIALEVVGEINEETVNFKENFDSTELEPVVLPSRLPNLLVNGAMGIAVGMATSIPPHNLRDTVKALIELLENPEIEISRLTTVLKGPDFPTGCQILSSKSNLNEIYRTGRGSVRMRGEWEIEDQRRGKKVIIITSVPYTVNKSQLVEKIAELILQKKVPQLSDIRDESTDKVRVVLELSAGADPETAMAYVFRHSSLESNFAVNLTALVPTESGALKPEVLDLKGCLKHFLDFRQQVVRRQLAFERRCLEERIHILEGLAKIFDALDEAIKIIRKSEGRADAAEKLRARFKLTELQAEAVVDMRLYQLSKTNIEEIRAELEEKRARVEEIDRLLKSKSGISKIIKQGLENIAEKYGDSRRSKIIYDTEEQEFDETQYVVREDVFAVVTKDGWIKRIRQTNDVGTTRLRDGDSILEAHPLNTVDSVAFLTTMGTLYLLKVSDFPSSSGYGEPIQKLLRFRDGERLVASYSVSESGKPQSDSSTQIKDGDRIVMITKRGIGFTAVVPEMKGLKRSGKRMIKVRDGDELIAVTPLNENLAFFTVKGSGLVVKGKESPIRQGVSIGVKLMGVRKDDALIAALSFARDTKIFIKLAGGKEKELTTKEITKGRRGLMGTKVITRGEIEGVSING